MGSQVTPPHLGCGELAGSNPAYSTKFASVAQLVERLLAMQKAVGSSPITRSICRFRAYIGNGCEIVSLVLLDEYVKIGRAHV